MKLEDFLVEMPEFTTIEAGIKGRQRQLITGISGSAETLLLSSIHRQLQQSQLIVTDDLSHMEQITNDLLNRLSDDQVFQFPVEENLAVEVATSSPEFRLQRVLALDALLSDRPVVVVTSTSGLKRLLPTTEVFKKARLQIKVGSDINLDQSRTQLSSMGYQLEKMVIRPGDFAIRGSILDIYPLNTENPVRIDLFDTEVDSLRYFDATTQRSIENIAQVSVLPATDFVISETEFTRIHQALTKQMTTTAKDLSDDQRQQLEQNISPTLKALTHQQIIPELIEFSNDVYTDKTSILDYLDENGIIVTEDYPRILTKEEDINDGQQAWLEAQVASQKLLSSAAMGHKVSDLITGDQHAQCFFALFQKGMGKVRFSQITNIMARNMQQFFGQMPVLKAEIERFNQQQRTTIILANSADRLDKIENTLNDFGISITLVENDELKPGIAQLVNDGLQNGFELPEANLVVITEAELFKTVQKKRARRQTLENAERIKSYTDLKPGDYVVHVNHGIGQFTGIETIESQGVKQDYIAIEFQKNAKIFVPVTQLNLVQKYVSSESKTPKINKLGGSEWAKTKRSVAAKIEDIAQELVALYAAREAEVGFNFPKDDDYQNQFENDFPYTETPDQLRSSSEIKRDMEGTKPMDRLLVGDVGYGKTEVALRAAFKAIEAGKQVAFLVPTTILAQQHFDSMQRRFEGYPVNVAMMSRFRTRKQLTETEEQLTSGECDIVVGTHRILSKDVHFKDLGLVIVDEEQRFGVKHKERLKQLKSSVDVLTLTATPIPRTLHMSMLGVRDLSVIETPPVGRFPIQTYVMEQNAGALRDAVMREMGRGGQVFYLHNRVADIEKTVAEISMLVPEARVGYINGQMTEVQLESVLYDFIRGEYDVLVTTSIIETGVDIPNVNTLFVEDADRMGLSQLYQIRGRIGRSNRVAYAYFMYQQNKVLTEVSEKRLSAIRDFTELGSGFKIAMRDLSIRGAGNLLGQQQHGFIDSVGYDLYSQMLADAVAVKRGEKVVVKTDTEIDVGIEAYLPSEYIDDQRQKMELYKSIRSLESEDRLLDLESDLIDRFGDFPVQVENLLAVGRLKIFADLAQLDKIRQQNGYLYVTLSENATTKITARELLKDLTVTGFKATIGDEAGKTRIKLVIQPKMTQKDWMEQLTVFVKALSEHFEGPGEQNDEESTTA